MRERKTASRERPLVEPAVSGARASVSAGTSPVAREVRTHPAALPAAHASRDGRDVQGVPLAALAACKRDRDEDELKQRVIAAAGRTDVCRSDVGHYELVETRNLNAFLMWIEHAPGRRIGDRCDELRLALRCLAQKGERP